MISGEVSHAGKGAAVRAGMLEAGGEQIVFSGADLATPPDQLRLLLPALEAHEVALGCRARAPCSRRWLHGAVDRREPEVVAAGAESRLSG